MKNTLVLGFSFVVAAALLVGDARLGAAQGLTKRKEMKELYDKGIALRKKGKFVEAIPFMEKAAALAPEVFGPDSAGTALYLHAAASIHDAAKSYRDAETYYRRALAIYDRKPPEDKLAEARLLFDLGMVLDNSGRPKDAKSMLERALKIRDAVVKYSDSHVAINLNNLAVICVELGDYDDAARHLYRCLKIHEEVAKVDVRGKDDSPDLANTLNNLADLEWRRGNYKEAEEHVRRSLRMHESRFGKDHERVARSLNNFGLILHAEGRSKEAETALRRALEIREKAFGKNHPTVATSLNNLGTLCSALGRFGEAEELLQRSIAMREKLFGPEHPSLAPVLNNLATVLEHTGREEERERLLLRSIKIREAIHGKNHPGLAPSLNNLAMFYSHMLRDKEAVVLFRRAIAIQEESFGKDHVHIAETVGNLAVVYLRMGENRNAETLLLRCLKINEAKLGPHHESVASNLANLGSVYWRFGDYAKANDHMARAQKILESVSGRDPKNVGIILQQRSALNHLLARESESLTFQERSLGIHLAHSRDLFAHSTEGQMHAYLEAHQDHLMHSLNFAIQSKEPADATASALTWTLRLKGSVFDTLAQYRQAQRLLPQDDSLHEMVTRYRSRKDFLANAAISPPLGITPENLKKQLEVAEQEVTDLEKELNRTLAKKLPGMFDKRETVTAEMTRSRLTPDSALVEFVRFHTHDYKARKWQEARYAAFILTPGKAPPRLIDLGPADKIDAGIETLRNEFTDFQEKLKECETAEEAQALEKTQEKQFKTKSAALYALLFAPLRKELGKASLLYLAPDGALNRLPFECLVDGDGKYLIESYRCAYLSSGRDLLRSADKVAKGTVVFAGPDFKVEASERLAQAEKLLKKKEETVLALRSSPGRDLRSAGFKALPGAAAEARDIEKTLAKGDYGPVTTYVGAQALEEVLKAMPAPRVLHLATHGFFLDRELSTPETTSEDVAGAGSARRRLKRAENPLLRSGIVLAGANTIGDKDAPANVEDGWVTAEEIALLNLHGTELVVLSACQTGLGDIKTGEGVYGLRRAFLHAGAQTLVTSLFEVPDTETRELMQRFYTGISARQGKLRALHSAQLGMIESRRQARGAAHPFFWASFVLVGRSD